MVNQKIVWLLNCGTLRIKIMGATFWTKFNGRTRL